MSTNPGNNIILDEVVSAYSHCPRKAYLLHCTDERGTPQEYQCILEERTRVTKARYLASLRQVNKTMASIVELIAGWSGNSPAQPPPVLLNKHCPYCPFKSVCAEQAKAADDLSLLDRMTPKIMRRYHSKGIFTVNQLSF